MEIVKFEDGKYGVRLIGVGGYKFVGRIDSSLFTYTASQYDGRKYWAFDELGDAQNVYEQVEASCLPDTGEVEHGCWT
jgi:hypothetical protein